MCIDSLVVDHQFYGSCIPSHWICHHYSGELFNILYALCIVCIKCFWKASKHLEKQERQFASKKSSYMSRLSSPRYCMEQSYGHFQLHR